MRIEIESIPNTNKARVLLVTDDGRTVKFESSDMCVELFPKERKPGEGLIERLSAPPQSFRVMADIADNSFTCTHE